MDAGLLDVLHHTAHVHLLTVEKRVHVDLDGVLEELVDQCGTVGADLGRVLEVAAQRILVVDDFHPAATEHV